jgi:hypothetical protein
VICPVVTRFRFCRLKRPEPEVDHVSPFNAKIKHAWIYIYVYIYMYCLIDYIFKASYLNKEGCDVAL